MDRQRTRRIAVAVGGLAALLALVVATRPWRRADAESRSAPGTIAQSREVSIPAEPAAPSSRAAFDASAPSRSALTPSDSNAGTAARAGLAPVRGRLVMQDGGPPPGRAVVFARTRRPEDDFPERVAEAGGAERFLDLYEHGNLERVLRGVGRGGGPRAEAAADGSFEVLVRPILAEFHLEVEADYALHRPQDRALSLDGREVAEGITLVLEPAGRLEGTIRTSAGVGVRDASLAFVSESGQSGDYPPLATTDSTGRFVVPALAAGRYQAASIGDGCAPSAREPFDVRVGETVRLDFTLDAESRVSGVVVDSDGNPAARVRVQAWSAEPGGPAFERGSALLGTLEYGGGRTDEAGRFRIKSLRSGRHTIGAHTGSGPAAASTEVDLPAGGEVGGVRLVVDRGRSVAGRVVDPEKRPVAAARVRAIPDFRSSKARPDPRSADGVTAADGAFRLTGLGDGPLAVEARAEGLGFAVVRDVAGDTDGLDMTLPGPTGLAGRVVDADTKAPLSRFTVRTIGVTDAEYGVSSRDLPTRRFDSPDGSFEFLDLVPGSYTLAFEASGYCPRTILRLAVKNGEVRRDLEIALDPAETVRGKVVERGSGTPVPSACLRWLNEAELFHAYLGGTPDGPRSGPDGAFAIAGVRPGPFRVLASCDGFVEGTSARFEAKRGETTEGVIVELGRGGSIEGLAIGSDGEPYANGGVEVYSTDGGGNHKRESIDASGHFRVTHLRPGRYRVTATPRSRPGETNSEGLRRVLYGAATVDEGSVTKVELAAARAGVCTVRGRVLRGIEPAPKASVSLKPTGEHADRDGIPRHAWIPSESVDDQGRYRFDGVPSGAATLVVTVQGSAPSFHRVVVPEAPELVADLVLPSGEIAGRVTLAPEGTPVSVAMSIQRADAPEAAGHREGWASARSDEDGRYRVVGLRAGLYVVSAVGFRTSDDPADHFARARSAPLSLADGERATVDLALERAGWAVVSVRDPRGRPLRDVNVALRPDGRSDDSSWLEMGGWSTDDEGVARIAGIAAGDYYATVETAGYAVPPADSKPVRPGKETKYSIDLKEGTRVGVRVEDARGEFVSAQVRFWDSRGGFVRAFRGIGPGMDPEDSTRCVAVLPPGDHRLTVEADGYRKREMSVTVGGGPPQEWVVRLERETPNR